MASTSSSELTWISSRSFLTTSGNSARSFAFRFGSRNVRIPPRCAASAFRADRQLAGFDREA